MVVLLQFYIFLHLANRCKVLSKKKEIFEYRKKFNYFNFRTKDLTKTTYFFSFLKETK